MIRNFFIVAFRNLRRNRVFSTINILGLAIGMASAVLIGLWIQNELGFDRFHVKEDRLYMAYRSEGRARLRMPTIIREDSGATLKADYPEVEDAVRLSNANFLFSAGDRHFNLAGNFTDGGFLKMFSFPLLEGNPNSALNDPGDIVITESLAKKLFGNEPALGKQLKIDSVDLVTVKGVLKDPPDNTIFKFDYLLPWSYLKKLAGTTITGRIIPCGHFTV
jgi:hypothetical protein